MEDRAQIQSSVASGPFNLGQKLLPTCTTQRPCTQSSLTHVPGNRFSLALKCVIFYYFIQHNVG